MSTIQIIELYFYCDDDDDDGPSMWILWLSRWTLSKEHMLNQQPLMRHVQMLTLLSVYRLKGDKIEIKMVVVGCPSVWSDYPDPTKEH